jgi:hypothetical protein
VLLILNLLELECLGLVLLSQLGDHVNEASVLMHDRLVLILGLDGCGFLSFSQHLYTIL